MVAGMPWQEWGRAQLTPMPRNPRARSDRPPGHPCPGDSRLWPLTAKSSGPSPRCERNFRQREPMIGCGGHAVQAGASAPQFFRHIQLSVNPISSLLRSITWRGRSQTYGRAIAQGRGRGSCPVRGADENNVFHEGQGFVAGIAANDRLFLRGELRSPSRLVLSTVCHSLSRCRSPSAWPASHPGCGQSRPFAAARGPGPRGRAH